MTPHQFRCCGYALVLSLVVMCTSASLAQIATHGGDGVLNAPYRGTITSLRELSMDLGYGEVENHVEPRIAGQSFTSSTLRIWHEVPVGYTGWDRSVLRLYGAVDASGPEFDLTGCTDLSTALVVSVTTGTFQRFSFRAMGTKTLATQNFRIVFRYNTGSGNNDFTRNIKVAPITGSFGGLPGESEAFHFGTPILDVAVGNARLVVPIGRKAEMIGAAFIDKDVVLGPSTIESSDYLFPGAAESVYIQNSLHFRLAGGGVSGPNKTNYGTPWAGHLIGFYNSPHIIGGDGTRYLNHATAINSATSGKEIRRTQYITPFFRNQADPPTQTYLFDGSNRVVTIQDGLSNAITLMRNPAGAVTRIMTSDGRGWNVESNDPNGWITGIVPDGGKGARYYSHNPDGRVTEVRLSPAAGTDVMYQFVYDASGDLREEWRYLDEEGQLRKVVEHIVESETVRKRREYFGPGVNDFRQYDFTYDTANALNHRLASITAHTQPGGLGTPLTTTYTHKVGAPTDSPNAAGTMVLTDVALPDSTTIHHDYDAQFNPQTGSTPSINFGLRTKTTHTGPGGSLVRADRDYEFFYPSGVNTRMFFQPRLARTRDGRGALSQAVYDHENGAADDNNDGFNGEDLNLLLKRTGPTITNVDLTTRTPETRYFYNDNVTAPTKAGTLRRTETDIASGQFRASEYGYDGLLRLTTQTVDPGGENILTQYQYADNVATQDRVTVDADNFYARRRFDNDGRVTTEERFLNAGGATGPVSTTTNVYDAFGWRLTRTVDHKDQLGSPLSPATIATQFSHDRLGRLTLQTADPGGIGQESNFDYDWLGGIERQFDTSGRGMKRAYDGRGLLAAETPLGSNQSPDTNLTTTYTYDENGQLQTSLPATGAEVERVYDDFGRLLQSIQHPGPDGGHVIATVFEYDSASNVTRTYVHEDATVLSDATAKFDEGGFNFESRRRAAAGADDPVDAVTPRKFDWAGNMIEERSLGDSTVADRVITTVYDSANRIASVLDSDGGETNYTRDDRGNVLQQEVKLQGTDYAITEFAYDGLGRATTVTDPEDAAGLHHFRERRYDSRGNLLRETARTSAGAAVQTSVFRYDNIGRQVQSATLASAAGFTDPQTTVNLTQDRVMDFLYDADGRLTLGRTYNNNSAAALTTTTTYDALGRADRVTDPSTSYSENHYDPANGRLTDRVVYDVVGTRTVALAYDGHDRVVEETRVGTPNLVTSFELDGLGRAVSVTDPKQITTLAFYDLLGRQTSVVEDALGVGAFERQTDYVYNRLSQLVEQTAYNAAADGTPLAEQVTVYRYDTLGRPIRAVYPDASAGEHSSPLACTDCVRTEYDLAGRMTLQTDPRGLVSAVAYEERGLPLSRTTGTSRDTWRYDALGRVTLADRGTIADPDAVAHSALAYTGLGDREYEDQAIAGGVALRVEYAYDQAGNRVEAVYPGGEVLSYVPTATNQVDAIGLDAAGLVDYVYQGRLLDSRVVTTDDPGGASYAYAVSYDGQRRKSGITNSVDSAARGLATIADYAFTYDAAGNPLTQTVNGGMAAFAGDDRVFTVDRLSRLTGTEYADSGAVEATVLDVLGNRAQHTDRAGAVIAYGATNAANEYSSVAGASVEYDPAGNLAVDEDGRQYSYDERNRLSEVRSAGDALLASYAYDALGRRISSSIGGVTTLYVYDGQNVIEERAGAAGAPGDRLRFHVNGAQFIDERVTTYDEAAGAFTYYLPNRDYSIAGTGNADGTVIERLDYSASGDFGGGGEGVLGYAHDADDDGHVDTRDYASFAGCLVSPDAACLAAHDFDVAGASDGTLDLADWASFGGRLSGPDQPAAGGCPRVPLQRGDTPESDDEYNYVLARGAGGPPPSGTFALHGRPVDVLPDGKVLTYVRARYYDGEHGRWLQRDPSGYGDGNNLYESFRGNALRNRDPFGNQAYGEGEDTGILADIERLLMPLFIPEARVQAASTPAALMPLRTSIVSNLVPAAEQVAMVEKRLEIVMTAMGPMLVRGAGTIGFVGAVVQTTEGTLIVVCTDGAGAWIGVPVAAHGLDSAWANLNQMLTGEVTETITYELIADTGHPYLARTVDVGIPFMGGVAALGQAPTRTLSLSSTAMRLTTPARELSLWGRVEESYQSFVNAMYRAKPGEAVLGLGPPRLPGPVTGEQLVFSFAELPPAGLLPIRPGRLGAQGTRAQIAAVVAELESRGWTVTRGGGKFPEEYLRGPGGGLLGANWVDITAVKDGRTLRINTIDTLADGITPTAREAAAAAAIRSKTGEHLLTIPKRD